MKLIIGNRNYSSWSLRGWLSAKQSGLSFEARGEHELKGLSGARPVFALLR